MCTQVAYVGKNSAAPVLLEMLEKIEGLWSGFYTGIATISEGEIFHDKVVGDVSALRKRTKSETFPGTTGIAHSRTPGQGDKEWGHPFLDCSGKMAFCEQGTLGIFKEESLPEIGKILSELSKAGHKFSSSMKKPESSAVTDALGNNVHISEVVCHMIEANFKISGDMLQAIGATLNKIKIEIAALSVSVDSPQQVFLACTNQSLAVGWDKDGAYVASSTLAFPASVQRSFRLPPGTAAVLTPADIKIVNIPAWNIVIENPFTPAEAEKTALEYLKENSGKLVGEIFHMYSQTLYPEKSLNRCHQTSMEVMEGLLRTKKITSSRKYIDGLEKGLTAPRTLFEIAKN